MRKYKENDIHFYYLDVIQNHEPSDYIFTFNIIARITLNIPLQVIRTSKRLPSVGGAKLLLVFIVPFSLLYLNPYEKQNNACDI